ncbi:MAG: hypothetical protein PHX20_06175 [Candidatus Omnitrophica bacterium]|nr:hypothetical protein [Candidatus Omnitrophota bacterium]
MERYGRVGELRPDEIAQLKREIGLITGTHFFVWGLSGAFRERKLPIFKGSHIDTLLTIFSDPRLGLSRDDFPWLFQKRTPPRGAKPPDVSDVVPPSFGGATNPEYYIPEILQQAGSMSRDALLAAFEGKNIPVKDVTLALAGLMEDGSIIEKDGLLHLAASAAAAVFGGAAVQHRTDAGSRRYHTRTAQQRSVDRAGLKRLLDKAQHTISELSNKTGIPCALVYADLKQMGLTRHPNLKREHNQRFDEKIRDDRARLKDLLDSGLYTARELSEKTGIAIADVRDDLMKSPALKNHPNRMSRSGKDAQVLKNLLDNGPHTPNQLAELSGIKIETVRKRLYRYSILGLHSNLVKERRVRSREKIQSDRALVKSMLDAGPHTVSELALKVDTPVETVRCSDIYSNTELRKHHNLIKEVIQRSPEKREADIARIEALLEDGIYSARELSIKTGIPIETIKSDLHRTRLEQHPNRRMVHAMRSAEQKKEDRMLLKSLLDAGPHNAIELSIESGVPITIVRHDLLRIEALRDHPNRRDLKNKFKKYGIITRSVVPAYTFSIDNLPEDDLELLDLIENRLDGNQLLVVKADLLSDISDKTLARELGISPESLPAIRKDAWNVLEKGFSAKEPQGDVSKMNAPRSAKRTGDEIGLSAPLKKHIEEVKANGISRENSLPRSAEQSHVMSAEERTRAPKGSTGPEHGDPRKANRGEVLEKRRDAADAARIAVEAANLHPGVQNSPQDTEVKRVKIKSAIPEGDTPIVLAAGAVKAEAITICEALFQMLSKGIGWSAIRTYNSLIEAKMEKRGSEVVGNLRRVVLDHAKQLGFDGEEAWKKIGEELKRMEDDPALRAQWIHVEIIRRCDFILNVWRKTSFEDVSKLINVLYNGIEGMDGYRDLQDILTSMIVDYRGKKIFSSEKMERLNEYVKKMRIPAGSAEPADETIRITNPAELLIAIRDDDGPGGLLAKALGEGFSVKNDLCPKIFSYNDRRLINKAYYNLVKPLIDVGIFVNMDGRIKFSDMMIDTRGRTREYARTLINVVNNVKLKINRGGDKLILRGSIPPEMRSLSREAVRMHIVDYAYKKAALAEKAYTIKAWEGYAALSQKPFLTEIRELTNGKVSFEENIDELVSFACTNVNDSTVTILPLKLLSEDQVRELEERKARVIYINLEGRHVESDDLTNLEGLIGVGRAYLNDDDESFYRLYRLLTLRPASYIPLKELKDNPVDFIKRLNFTLKPITPYDPSEHDRLKHLHESLLRSA